MAYMVILKINDLKIYIVEDLYSYFSNQNLDY